MADKKNVFKNPLLDIKYDLSHNIIEGITATSEELSNTLHTISLWRKHIAYQILGTSCRQYSVDFGQTYKSWFRQVENIFQNEDDNVKVMAPLIGNQILKFLEILCELECFLNPSDLLCFLKNLQAASNGTIDCIKAVIFLIDSTKLSQANKISIACYFCLTEKIIDLVEIESLESIDFSSKNSFRSEMFFIYSLNGKSKEFNEKLKKQLEVNESTLEHLLLWAIRNENQLAVHHYWDMICIRNPIHDVKRFVTYALDFNSSNIVSFLISKIKEDEQIKSLCIKEGYKVLSKLGNDFRWSDYFKTVEDYLLQFINEMDFRNYLKIIIFCWIKNEPERNRYRKLLSTFSAKFKVDIQIDFIFNSSLILKILLAVYDETIAETLLEIKSVQEVIFMDTVCLELIYQNCFELFVALITDALVKEDVDDFKKSFFVKHKSEIFEHLITKNKFVTLDEVLIYFYSDEKICIKLKEELPYQEQGKLVADMFENDAPSNEIEECIERFLLWCFDGDLEKTEDCHYTLFNTQSTAYAYCIKKFGSFIKHLLDLEKLFQLDAFLNWALPVRGERLLIKCTPSSKYFIKKYKAIAFATKN